MDIGIIGKKVGMTQLFEDGNVSVSVTVIKAGPCTIVQRKTKDSDGYSAVQLGFEDKKKNVKKPLHGHFKRCGVSPKNVLREFRVDSDGEYQAGQEIRTDMFTPGDFVDVTGISKGKGFTGVMKRWGFAGGPGSHGAHKWNRRPGSIGASADPSRVLKGMKMAGQSGKKQVAAQNLKVMRVDKEKNLLMVKGAVPGANGGYLIIKKAVRKGNI